MPRAVVILIVLTGAALAAGVLALTTGALALSPQRVVLALAGQGDALARQIVWTVRLPRALAAFAVGVCWRWPGR